MSLSNILEPNSYHLYCDQITTNPPTITSNYIPTLSAGLITSMEVRGVTGTNVPISLIKNNTHVSMVIAQFSILTVSAGGATRIIFPAIPLIYRPTYNILIPVILYSGTVTYVNGFISITTNGTFDLQKTDQSAFTIEFGSYNDVVVDWNIV